MPLPGLPGLHYWGDLVLQQLVVLLGVAMLGLPQLKTESNEQVEQELCCRCSAGCTRVLPAAACNEQSCLSPLSQHCLVPADTEQQQSTGFPTAAYVLLHMHNSLHCMPHQVHMGTHIHTLSCMQACNL